MKKVLLAGLFLMMGHDVIFSDFDFVRPETEGVQSNQSQPSRSFIDTIRYHLGRLKERIFGPSKSSNYSDNNIFTSPMPEGFDSDEPVRKSSSKATSNSDESQSKTNKPKTNKQKKPNVKNRKSETNQDSVPLSQSDFNSSKSKQAKSRSPKTDSEQKSKNFRSKTGQSAKSEQQFDYNAQNESSQSQSEPKTKLGLSEDNPYSILGVDKNASPQAIKQAYMKLVLQLHPDKTVGLSQGEQIAAADKFKVVQNAYEALTKNN